MHSNEELYTKFRNTLELLEMKDNTILNRFAEMLKENIREENAKKAGAKVNHIKLVKAIIKENLSDSLRQKWAKAILWGDNYFFTNGYYVLIDNHDYGYDHIEVVKAVNLVRNITAITKEERLYSVKINMDDLRLFISTHKKEKEKKPYVIEYDENKKIGFSPKALLICLQWAGTDKIEVGDKENKPACIKGDTSRWAILMPMLINN